jgi:uncharacterized protein (UPF0212 family)
MNLKLDDIKMLTTGELIEIVEENYEQYPLEIIEKAEEELTYRGREFIENRIHIRISCPECSEPMEHGWIYNRESLFGLFIFGFSFKDTFLKSRTHKEKKPITIIHDNGEKRIPGLICHKCGLIQLHYENR